MIRFQPDILPRMALAVCLVQAAPALVAQIYSMPDARSGAAQTLPAQAEQLFALGNQTRASFGLSTLQWDPALANAALQHCMRMTKGGAISHQYRGEADPSQRAATAGAHFSQISENIATGPYASGIHQSWLNSPPHRKNLLSPGIDRIGIAVVSRGGVLYAVADYARAATVLTHDQVVIQVAGLLRSTGVAVYSGSSDLQAYCVSNGHFRTTGVDSPSFVIRWQNSDLSQLPPDLVIRATSRHYRKAAVSSCPAQDDAAGFTAYRVAVMLYGTDSAAFASR
jgi:uncharacterized protein YkwD